LIVLAFWEWGGGGVKIQNLCENRTHVKFLDFQTFKLLDFSKRLKVLLHKNIEIFNEIFKN
jgi:hypothetical protein